MMKMDRGIVRRALSACLLCTWGWGCSEASRNRERTAALSVALGSEDSVFVDDFEGGADETAWSSDHRRLEYDEDGNQNTSLGPQFGVDAVSLTLHDLPSHNRLTVSFDAHVFGPWAGNHFELAGDGTLVAATSFSNGSEEQAFPDQIGGPTHPAQTGAIAVDIQDLGFGDAPRAIYHLKYTFVHGEGDVVLTFATPELADEAAWALDNVDVEATTFEGPPLCSDESPGLDDHNPCTADSCNPSVGIVHTPMPAGTLCSDGQVCNGVEQCDAQGACQAGTPPSPEELPADDHTCDAVDDDCDGRIDEDFVSECTDGGVTACSNGSVSVVSCDDGDLCTSDACAAGACTHGSVSCDDGNSCTADSCDSTLGCVSVVDQMASCSDGDVCTEVDHCDAAGACIGGSPADPDDGNPCTDDVCDPISGVQHSAVAGRSCDDGNACTVVDSCNAGGACVPGAARECSDGAFCNGLETCAPSSGCVAGTPPALSDGIACTVDSCDEATLSILHQPDHTACSDHDACSGVELCDVDLGCRPGTPLVVDDGNPCTVDSCDPATGALAHVPSDGLCNDQNACTSDHCDLNAGCQHADISAACDDHDVCSGAESCDPSLGCRPGNPLVLDDGNPCTADSCDPVLGVKHTLLAIGTACGASAHYCDGSGQCLAFSQCATSLSVNSGQNLSFTGPCQIDAISFNGGNLTINGALRTPLVTLQSGGTLKVTGSALITDTITVGNGNVNTDGNVGGVIHETGGTIRVGGKLDVAQASAFSLSAGKFTNDGTVSLPVFDGSVVSGGTFVNKGRLNIGTDSITVAGGVTLSESGQLGADDHIGTLNVLANGKLTHELRYLPGLSFSVTGNATIAQDGAIDVSNLGLRGGWAGGNNTNAGETFSADGTSVIAGSIGHAGGSYGGRGGRSTNDAGESTAPVYGSTSTPVLLGSGGGTANGCCGGGHGGGRVDLFVAGSLTVNGVIRANGQTVSTGWSGGGSGGALRLRVDTWAGSGALSANGGTGDGGGGGGRVAIEYRARTFTGTVTTAFGAGGAGAGMAGTVYLKDTTSNVAEYVIDNNGVNTVTNLQASDIAGQRLTIKSSVVNLIGAAAPLALKLTGGTLNLGALDMGSVAGSFTMSGGKLVGTGRIQLPSFDETAVSGGTFVNQGELDVASDSITVGSGVTLSESGSLGPSDSIGTLRVRANGKVTHELGYVSGVSFTVRGDATVESNGLIDVNAKGLRGGLNGGNTSNTGETYAADLRTVVPGATGAAGGSHGGVGGIGSNVPGGAVTASFGSQSSPVLFGGGGATGNGCCGGGHGGGRVDLVVNGRLRVDGTIRADGQDGNTSWSGGGAGGSVRLQLGTWSGSGALTANGGNGDGGGGGGRVSVVYRSKDFTGLVTAKGVAATANWSASTAGTTFERNLTSNPLTVSAAIDSGADSFCRLGANGALDCHGNPELVLPAPIGGYSKLALGPYAACVLNDSGSAQCWGELAAHHLFDEPTAALTGIAVGASAACGIRQSDGNVVCFGDNADNIISGTPAGAFVAVAMAEHSACAQRAAGTIACFGDDATSAVSGAPGDAFLALAGGAGFFCGVRLDGNLSCWGDNSHGQATPPAGATFTAVSAGARHACALAQDGSVQCWGDNAAGQATPAAGAFTAIAAGDLYSCGLRMDGSYLCWGAAP